MLSDTHKKTLNPSTSDPYTSVFPVYVFIKHACLQVGEVTTLNVLHVGLVDEKEYVCTWPWERKERRQQLPLPNNMYQHAKRITKIYTAYPCIHTRRMFLQFIHTVCNYYVINLKLLILFNLLLLCNVQTLRQITFWCFGNFVSWHFHANKSLEKWSQSNW